MPRSPAEIQADLDNLLALRAKGVWEVELEGDQRIRYAHDLNDRIAALQTELNGALGTPQARVLDVTVDRGFE